MLFSWTPEQCLKMPARRFFSVIRAGRQLDHEKSALRYFEMTKVSQCSNSSVQYIHELQNHYRSAIRQKKAPKKPALSNKDAAKKLNKLLSINIGGRA